MPFATWKLCGPAFNGFADNPNAPLGCSYAANMDGRWHELVLGPLVTAISMTAAGGTTTNLRCGAFSEGASTTTECLVVGRGTEPGIIDLNTRLNVADGSHAGWSSAVTDMMFSQSDAGVAEISVALASNIYRVITAVPVTGTLTDTANNESKIYKHFGKGASTSTSIGVAYGLGRGATSIENLIESNILTGATTMDASAYATRATVSGEPITFTGMVAVGDQFIVCTSNGPYLLNDIYQRFEPLQPELDNNANNGKGAFNWSAVGAFVPSTTGLRLFPTGSVYTSMSVGPEVFRRNISPIKGRMLTGWASSRWGYFVFYDPIGDDSYICAGRPNEEGDWHTNPMSYFPIIRLADLDCEFGTFAGTKGSQTQPTHYLGRDTDAGWFIDGLTDTRFDDSNATYATTGTLYGTELRMPRPVRLKSIQYPTKNVASGRTITASITYRDTKGVSETVAFAGETQSGWMKIPISENKLPNPVMWFAPQIDMVTATATSTPSIPDDGFFLVEYDYADDFRSTSGGRV